MLGILLGLVLLIILCYRGYSIIWVAPLCALVVAFTGSLDLLPAYTTTYMNGLGGFLIKWFPIFLLGAVFGKIMEVTKAAKSVANLLVKLIGTNRAILAIVISCAVLTYGGVSLFVVVFAIYPIALALFREANYPRRIIPGCIALGSFTFTMTAIPGTPQIQNLIPMQYFHTTALAAPIMGIIAAVIMFLGGLSYLTWRKNKLVSNGEHYDEPENLVIENTENETLPNPFLSFLPLIVVVVTLNVFKLHIILSLLLGVIVCMLINVKEAKNFIGALTSGANGSILAIFNTSAAVGFGAVVKAVPGFAALTSLLLGIKGSPLISEAFSISVLAGATGSASGGMSIALEALGSKYYEIAQVLNISPEAFHRVASVASGGLDTLPHNGAVLTLLAVCSMTHKKSYLDIGVVSLAIPLLATVAIIIAASFGLV